MNDFFFFIQVVDGNIKILWQVFYDMCRGDVFEIFDGYGW